MTIVDRIKRMLAERKAIRALADLDDYTLKDIGIQRGNIRSVVRGL